MRCGLHAGWRDGSERLCQETDESQLVINNKRGAYFVTIPRRCASPKTTIWSTHLRRIDPINLSAKPFCQGEDVPMMLPARALTFAWARTTDSEKTRPLASGSR